MIGNNLEFSDEEIIELAKEKDLTNIELPYVVKNHVIFSPGTHNGAFYSKEAIKQAFQMTQWDNPKVHYLYYEHRDEFGYDPQTGEKTKVVGADARDWVGEVKNIRFDERTGELIGDIYFVDEEAARKIAYGVNFGISPRGRGERKGNVVRNFVIDNFALVVNPAIKSTYFNSEGEVNYGYFIALSEIDDNLKEENKMSEKELMEELAKLREELEELKKKKKEYPEPVDEKKEEEMKKKKEEEEELKKKKYPEYPEEQSEESDELTDEEIANFTVEEFKTWKELVKKYGVKEAKKLYKKEKEKKMSEDMETIKSELNELKSKLDQPAESTTYIPTEDEKTVEQMNETDIDINFGKMLQDMKGYEVTL